MLSAVGLWVLVCLARPFNWWRTLLVAAMVGSIVVILLVPALRNFYELRACPTSTVVAQMIVISVLSVVAIEAVWRITQNIIERRNPEYAAAASDL